MALIYCSACGKQISADAASCPQCGHPNSSARKKSGSGSTFWTVIGVLAVLFVIAGMLLAVTKPSEAQLRAAAEAKMDSYFKVEYRPDGKKVRTLVDERGGAVWWVRRDAWQYRNRLFWSELVLAYPDGREVWVAFGFAGNIRVIDD
jgi:hypothetical protein